MVLDPESIHAVMIVHKLLYMLHLYLSKLQMQGGFHICNMFA